MGSSAQRGASARGVVEHALRPLDWVRWRVLRALAPLIRPLIARREVRVGVGGVVLVASALVLTVAAPMWLLALGPVTLGVAHVVSDVRYLVIRPGYHARWPLWIAAGVPLLAVSLGGGVWAGLVGCAAVVGVARGSLARKVAAWAMVGALMWGAWRAGWAAELIFVHAHNAIAVLLWWLWRERSSPWYGLPLLAFGAGSAVLLSGVLEAELVAWGALSWHPEGLDIGYFLRSLTRGVEVAPWDLRLLLLFAFAQAVHYSIWLRLIPEDDRPQPTPRTFVSSYRALREEFGAAALAVVAVFAVGVGVWALVDLFAAHEGYLRAAAFHGHLELAVLALWWVERRGEEAGGSGPPRAVADHEGADGGQQDEQRRVAG